MLGRILNTFLLLFSLSALAAGDEMPDLPPPVVPLGQENLSDDKGGPEVGGAPRNVTVSLAPLLSEGFNAEAASNLTSVPSARANPPKPRRAIPNTGVNRVLPPNFEPLVDFRKLSHQTRRVWILSMTTQWVLNHRDNSVIDFEIRNIEENPDRLSKIHTLEQQLRAPDFTGARKSQLKASLKNVEMAYQQFKELYFSLRKRKIIAPISQQFATTCGVDLDFAIVEPKMCEAELEGANATARLANSGAEEPPCKVRRNDQHQSQSRGPVQMMGLGNAPTATAGPNPMSAMQQLINVAELERQTPHLMQEVPGAVAAAAAPAAPPSSFEDREDDAA